MMSTIYGCAIVTIMAMNGNNANSGLAGISAPRGAQLKETIGGCVLFTTPASEQWEKERSIYSSRAWTLQEEFLSRRSICFTSGQLVFSCISSGVEECHDIASLSDHIRQPQHPAALEELDIFAMVRKASIVHSNFVYAH